MLDGLTIAQKFIHKTDLLLMTIHCIVLTWELATHSKQQVLVKAKGYVYVFEQLLIKAFTYRAIAWPFASLAIARFYVHSLQTWTKRCFTFSPPHQSLL